MDPPDFHIALRHKELIEAAEANLVAYAEHLEKAYRRTWPQSSLDAQKQNAIDSINILRSADRFSNAHILKSGEARELILSRLEKAVHEGDARTIREIGRSKTCGLKPALQSTGMHRSATKPRPYR